MALGACRNEFDDVIMYVGAYEMSECVGCHMMNAGVSVEGCVVDFGEEFVAELFVGREECSVGCLACSDKLIVEGVAGVVFTAGEGGIDMV